MICLQEAVCILQAWDRRKKGKQFQHIKDREWERARNLPSGTQATARSGCESAVKNNNGRVSTKQNGRSISLSNFRLQASGTIADKQLLAVQKLKSPRNKNVGVNKTSRPQCHHNRAVISFAAYESEPGACSNKFPFYTLFDTLERRQSWEHFPHCNLQTTSFFLKCLTYNISQPSSSTTLLQMRCKRDHIVRTETVRSQEDTAWGSLTVPSWQTATNMSCGAQVDHSTASGILQVRVVALVSMVILPRLYTLITAASQSATFMDRKNCCKSEHGSMYQ